MAKQTLWALVTVAALGSLLSAACASGSGPEEIALQRAKSLPQLSSSNLIEARSGIDQGSQDECYAGYVEALYATDVSGTEVIQFYRTYVGDNLWAINEDFSNDSRLSVRKPDEGLYLGVVLLVPRSSPTRGYPSLLDRKIIDEALDKFKTVYLVTVTYTEPDFRSRCS